MLSRPSRAGPVATAPREGAAAAGMGMGMNIDGVAGSGLGAGQDSQQDHHQNSTFLDDLNQSWADIEEDEFGNLLVSGKLAREKRLRERRAHLITHASTAKRIRRGMMRFVQVVVDLSRASLMGDMRPSRLQVIGVELQRFVNLFFDTNPLSQLSISCTRNGVAKVITELSGSPHKHIEQLKLLGTQKLGLDGAGDASLQNCLDLSLKQLRDVPPYGHREVLFLMTSLTTCDPGNVFETIEQARLNRMHCSVIGVGAEVYILKHLADKTKGKYSIVTNETHLRCVLEDYAPPPPSLAKETPSSLVQMGFPNFASSGDQEQSLCFVGQESDLSKTKSFTCPRCKSRVKDLPQACHVCGLSLVSSAHLARSYHHLFPVPLFKEVLEEEEEEEKEEKEKEEEEEKETSTSLTTSEKETQKKRKSESESKTCTRRSGLLRSDHSCCYACGKDLSSSESSSNITLRCPKCGQCYCITCDVFIHEQLHNCPGCEE